MSDEALVEDTTREQIAAKAYELYCARGCEDGHDLEDWLEAEALIVAATGGPATGRTPAEEGDDDVGGS